MNNHLSAAVALTAMLLSGGETAASTAPLTTESGERLERIVVRGTQTSLESSRLEAALTPGGTELLDIEEFRERNVSSLADVLHYVPGVWSSSDSGSDTVFFSSRGSNLDATDYDLNGVKLLKDGLPITTADGNNHNRVVDPLSAANVTFARGANAMKYGASTLGGAANFVSVVARDSEPLDLSISGGSFGQRLGRFTASRAFNETFDALLTVESKQWEGYRAHNEQQRTGLYGNAGWQLTEAVATRFYGTWIENDEELPGPLSRAQVADDPRQANPAAVRGNYQVNVDAWRIANKTSWQIGPGRRLDAGFSTERQSLYHPIVAPVLVDFDGDGPAPPVEVFSLLIDTDLRNSGAVLRYNQRLGDHDLLAGFNYGDSTVDGGHYRNLAGMRNGLSARVATDASVVEAFAMDRWSVGERLVLVLGAQAVQTSREVRETDVASGALRLLDGDYSSINPRVGLLYDVRDDVTVYGNVSRLFEAPTNYQLQDNVAGGNATLDPMEGTVIEVGTRGTRDVGAASSFSWDLSLYHGWIRNEILSVDDPAAPGTSLSTNVEDTVHAGLEAVARATLVLDDAHGRVLEPVISVSVNRFEFDGDPRYGNNRLPAAPRYTVRGELLYRDGNGLWIGPTFELTGERYADFANTYEVERYALLGARAGWSGDRWSVFAEVRNLLDEEYIANHNVRSIAAPDAEILNPGTPRSVFAGVRWRLE